MVFCLSVTISRVFKLGPGVNGALGDVAVLILGGNLLLREDLAPQVELCQLARPKGVRGLELVSHFILILSEHNSTSLWNYMAFHLVCSTIYSFAIHVQLVVPVNVFPSRADVMKLVVFDINF